LCVVENFVEHFPDYYDTKLEYISIITNYQEIAKLQILEF